MDSPVDDFILILRDLIERIPHRKSNTITKESQLCGTFVDAMIRPIQDDPDNNEFLVWSNIKISDKSERPDITGMMLIDASLYEPVCVGEIKGEDKRHDTHALAYDLLKMAAFSKEAIDGNEYLGILGVHVIGFQFTLYITTLLTEGLCVMFELVSIPIPSIIYDMKAFIANLEDLMPIKALYKNCIQINNSVQQVKKQDANLQAISQSIQPGKDRKQHCSCVCNH
ncbi:uncharacterized protein ATC70_006153 [Mucor velutinosus]|uniref:Uncharacterized protein n=1 Tax=Mucor velutinosus TaxID=708070 RepID=A0AAN7DB83_9FUNG|nr:hypothetical protein ATC70_006153 [Mucor velutinosus]